MGSMGSENVREEGGRMSQTVLIVEDERKLRELIADYLEAEGLAWIEAANGDDAVALFREASPDLVILDILMPGLDGYDVCEEIRKLSDVPILFLTAKSEEEESCSATTWAPTIT